MTLSAFFNTRGGEVGFVAELADGRRVSERDSTWEDLPRESIRSLSVVHFPTGHVFVVAKGYSGYYFANVAFGARQGLSQHCSKIVGVVHPVGATEWRMDFVAGPVPVRHPPFHFDAPPWAASQVRPGV